jgi:hypothetical protein
MVQHLWDWCRRRLGPSAATLHNPYHVPDTWIGMLTMENIEPRGGGGVPPERYDDRRLRSAGRFPPSLPIPDAWHLLRQPPPAARRARTLATAHGDPLARPPQLRPTKGSVCPETRSRSALTSTRPGSAATKPSPSPSYQGRRMGRTAKQFGHLRVGRSSVTTICKMAPVSNTNPPATQEAKIAITTPIAPSNQPAVIAPGDLTRCVDGTNQVPHCRQGGCDKSLRQCLHTTAAFWMVSAQ